MKDKPDPTKLLSLSTFEDVKKFTEKYVDNEHYETSEEEYQEKKQYQKVMLNEKYTRKEYVEDAKIGYYNFNFPKTQRDYGGIEIKNFYKIQREIFTGKNWKLNVMKYDWFTGLDFSSGCIWNLDIIKDIEYVRKVSAKELKELKKYKVC
jgi:hypothetical protein